MGDFLTDSDFPQDLPTGTMLGNYIIRKVIGSGEFTITYLAQDKVTDKLVIIKENYPTDISCRNIDTLEIGPAEQSRKEDYNWVLTRFEEEAIRLSRLSHPNIVPIHNAFKAIGTAYYVMPHVEGTGLDKAAPAPDSINAEWLQPVLEKILHALDYLHGQGLIHRDIKPSNILLRTDGEPILIDFGTARALESTHSHSQIGTSGFMPFEQHSARGWLGPWTDLYALGATCYRLLTGEIPPDSRKHMEWDEYLPLADRPSLTERFPVHFLKSIDKALLRDPAERWQSAQEWLNALKHEPSSQMPAQTSLKKRARFFNKNLILFLLIAVLTCGGFYYLEWPTVTNFYLVSTSHEHYGLCTAASNGDTERIRHLLVVGYDVNETNMDGNTPLFCAAQFGHTECVRLLLTASGINVNQANRFGDTPLSVAERNHYTECAELIRKAGGR